MKIQLGYLKIILRRQNLFWLIICIQVWYGDGDKIYDQKNNLNSKIIDKVIL